MAEVIRMPKMSDTMTEGTIVEWHKKVGDKVKPGDVLAEIETDKAVMEFESFQEGTLLHIGVEKGQAVKVNDVIAVIGKEGEDYKSALNQGGASEKEKGGKPSEEKSAPKEKAKESSSEKKKEVPEETRSERKEKAPAEKEETKESKAEEEKSGSEKSVSDSNRIKASPLAKKIAGDSKVPLEKIKGSGDEGRIIRRDVEKFLSQKPATSSQQFPQISEEESYDEIAVSQMRKTIARRLVESKFSAPHFYLTMEINMDRCADMRTQINDLHPDEKISFNDIIIKAVALSLRKNLKVNSSWLGDPDGTGHVKIRYNHHIHIGMAVAVEDGLLVPVIKFADQKSFLQINTEAKIFAARAKEKKLQPEEMTGNTFTISNLGMMDIDEFTAIINPPDACILAVGKIKKQPIVVMIR